MSGWGMVGGRKFGNPGVEDSRSDRAASSQVHATVSFKEPLVARVQLDTSGEHSELAANLRLALPSASQLSLQAWRLTAFVAFIAVVLATLCPPFYLPLAGGFQTSMGFGFIFAPPQQGTLVALVNVPLLVAEYVAILAAALLALVWGPAAAAHLAN